MWTVLNVAVGDSKGLLLGLTVDARVSGAGDVTATDSTSTSLRTLHRKKDPTSDHERARLMLLHFLRIDGIIRIESTFSIN